MNCGGICEPKGGGGAGSGCGGSGSAPNPASQAYAGSALGSCPLCGGGGMPGKGAPCANLINGQLGASGGYAPFKANARVSPDCVPF